MYNLYIDGGGTPKVPTYFSFKCIERPEISVCRLLTRNIPKHLVPPNCKLVRQDGNETNNLAEMMVLYFALKAFKASLGQQPVIVYHDSENTVYQILGMRQVKAVHLLPWYYAIKKIWWKKINYQWVPRNIIKEVLGH